MPWEFTIRGRVVVRGTGAGVPDVRVEAWEKDAYGSDTRVGVARTDDEGQFTIQFDGAQFANERGPDLYFRVLQGNRLVASTEETIQGNLNPGSTTVTIDVDPAALDGQGERPTSGDPDAPPPVDNTIPSTVVAQTEHLYTGDDPHQKGVDPAVFELRRAAALRGRVETRAGEPLAGVAVTIPGRPEYGYAESRADGTYDLAVNGGETLTVRYEKADFLPAQRKLPADWQSFTTAPDVALVPAEAITATTVDLTAPEPQVARGSVNEDSDGVRQPTVLFPAELTAPVTNLEVQIGEFTTTAPDDLPADAHTDAVAAFIERARSQHGEDLIMLYIFGSTARGEASGRSSDVLVVLPDGPDHDAIADSLRDIAYDVRLEYGPLVELHILDEATFERHQRQRNPFVRNVLREGRSYA